jgi:serine protease Do
MSFDGERVRSARQFARLVEETPAGRSVKAEVMRDGRQTDLQVTPDGGSGLAMTLPRHGGWRGEWNMPAPGMRIEPFEFEFPGDGPFGLIAGRGRLGVGIQNLTPELAAHFGAKQGVLVNSVDPDSPGAKAGVKVGDVITSIDGSSVDDGGELRRKLWEQDDATEVTLGIVRDGKAMDLKVSLDGQRTGGGVGRTRRRV